jgi:hypothetical protein
MNKEKILKKGYVYLFHNNRLSEIGVRDILTVSDTYLSHLNSVIISEKDYKGDFIQIFALFNYTITAIYIQANKVNEYLFESKFEYYLFKCKKILNVSFRIS